LKTIREEGRAEGREEGREEGRAEGKAEIVLEMLKENQPLDFISRVSKYSKEKIAEIGRLHGVL
jgi:predicted transposase YdaD